MLRMRVEYVVELGRQPVEAARARQVDVDDLDDAARARPHHHDAVGQQHRFRNAVRDVQRRLAPFHPELLDVHRDLLARQRVERAERLVHHQHDRIMHERAADRDALTHAAGQFVRLLPLEALEPRGLEQVHGDGLVLGAVHPPDVDLQHHVRQDVTPVEHDGVLEDDADIGLRLVDAFASNRDCSRAVGRQAGDHFENGGLAATAGANDGNEFRLPDVEIDVGAGVDRAVLGLVASC